MAVLHLATQDRQTSSARGPLSGTGRVDCTRAFVTIVAVPKRGATKTARLIESAKAGIFSLGTGLTRKVHTMSKRKQLEKMLEASPDDEFLKYALAMACSSEGNEEEAVRRLALLNEENPDNVSAWFQRAQILSRMGKPEDAAEVCRNGIEEVRRTVDDHAEAEMIGFLDLI